MSIRKRGNAWQVRVPGWRDETFPTREAAEVAELDRKLKNKLGHLQPETPTSFGEELDRELATKRSTPRGLRPATERFYRQSAQPWEPLRKVSVPNLRVSTIEDHYAARHRVAPVAARNELAFAKQTLRSAEARGQRVDHRIYAIRPRKHVAATGQALEPDALDTIASWMPERVKRIVLLCGTLGLRWAEATGMTDEMLDLDNATLTIPATLNKSRAEKPVKLAAVEVRLLREQLLVRPAGARLVFPNAKGGRYSESGFRKVWHRATRKAGYSGFKFHWLRHTAISLMARSGMKPEVIAERVGHSDGGALIHRRYRHLYASEVTAAVSSLDAFLAAQRGQEMVEEAEEA